MEETNKGRQNGPIFSEPFFYLPLSKGYPSLKSASRAPHRKVLAATTGAALGSALGIIAGIIVTSSLIPVLKNLKIEIRDDDYKPLENAITVVCTLTITFIFGYVVPPGLGELAVIDDKANKNPEQEVQEDLDKPKP